MFKTVLVLSVLLSSGNVFAAKSMDYQPDVGNAHSYVLDVCSIDDVPCQRVAFQRFLDCDQIYRGDTKRTKECANRMRKSK